MFAVISSSCVNSVFDVRPRRACGLAVCTDKGVRELVGVAAPSDPVGSFLVEILCVSKAGM